MNTPVSLDYFSEYLDLEPSLFRESDNLHRLLQAVFSVMETQQQDFLWLSQNILNIDVAEGAHLDFIGGIVGQSRLLSDFNTEPYFGFERSYQSETFGVSNDPSVGGYWNSRSYFNTATSRKLTDEEYRRILKARVIYNQSNCISQDLIEVVNLITNRSDNTVQILEHGLIRLGSGDTTGLLAYFVDKLDTISNILPIAAGVRLRLANLSVPSNGIFGFKDQEDSYTFGEINDSGVGGYWNPLREIP